MNQNKFISDLALILSVYALLLSCCLYFSSAFATETATGISAASTSAVSAERKEPTLSPKDKASTEKSKPEELTSTFWITIVMVSVILIFTLVLIKKTLKASDWKLADALSEEAELPDGSKTADAGNQCKPLMVASSSRLIAFLGSLVLITMFIGFGYYMIWAYFSNRTIPEFKNITDFLWAGAGMFLPYAVNQARTAISNVAK